MTADLKNAHSRTEKNIENNQKVSGRTEFASRKFTLKDHNLNSYSQNQENNCHILKLPDLTRVQPTSTFQLFIEKHISSYKRQTAWSNI